jgi:hypothetical protein
MKLWKSRMVLNNKLFSLKLAKNLLRSNQKKKKKKLSNFQRIVADFLKSQWRKNEENRITEGSNKN